MNSENLISIINELFDQNKIRQGSYEVLVKKALYGYKNTRETLSKYLPTLVNSKYKISWSSIQKEKKTQETFIKKAQELYEANKKKTEILRKKYAQAIKPREPAQFVEEKQAFNGSAKVLRASIGFKKSIDMQQLLITHRYDISEQLKTIINNKRSVKFKISVNVSLDFKKDRRIEDVVFNSHHVILNNIHEIPEKLELAHQQINTRFEGYQKASDMRIVKINSLKISYVKYNPMKGSSYIDLPDWIKSKKACVNVHNTDQKCFLWAVASSLYPVEKDAQRTSKYDISKFKIDGLEFPMKLSQIKKFEEMNDVNVNVANVEGKEITRIYHNDKEYSKSVELLLIHEGKNSHYVCIKNLSRLLHLRHNYQIYPCTRCLSVFKSEDKLNEHGKLCRKFETTSYEMPDEGEVYEFKNYQKQQRVPFVIYADFEAILPKFQWAKKKGGSYTEKTQVHEASGFCFKTVCIHEKFNNMVLYRGQDSDKKFITLIKKEMDRIINLYKKDEGMTLTNGEKKEHEKAKVCYICKDSFVDTDGGRKVKDHDHLTGKYRGPAHQSCNKKFRYPPFIPVVFHNLRGYDSHFIINNITNEFKKIDCIPNNEEKYISFSLDKLRFIDSIQFMNASLENLVENLKKNGVDAFKHMKNVFQDKTEFMLGKGIYPYEYADTIEKFNEMVKPKKEDFYSSLYDSGITDEEYKRFCDVWETMEIKNFGQYHDLYLKTDVLQLADVFETFRDVCFEYYGLDACHYYTAPGLSWDALLKMTDVRLQALNDIDMYLFFEMSKRGGVSMISHRYAQANNKYMKTGYDPKKKSVYLIDWDANNLYGWAMSQYLPVDGFEWGNPTEWTAEKILQLSDTSNVGYTFQVDLKYPQHLHDLHNDYPLAPENKIIDNVSPWCQRLGESLGLKPAKVGKLVPNLNDKKDYIIDYRALKQCLDMGLELSAVSKVIKYNQEPWMKKYISFNTEKRKVAKNDFERDFFKLMNNSVFGKTMENIRGRINFRLINDEKKLERAANKPTFKDLVHFNNNLVGVHMLKNKITLNKPIYVGGAILDLSKVLMYNFHYNVIKKDFGNKAQLLATDTDSLKYAIECDDLYKYMNENKKYFDLSDYPTDHFCYDASNKKKLGCMKDELNGTVMTEFVGLRAKMYAQRTADKDKKVAKGIKKCVIKNNLTVDEYKEALFEGKNIYKTMKTFRSYGHKLYTIEMNKSGLCAYDDKRLVLSDGITTRAHGHYLGWSENKKI